MKNLLVLSFALIATFSNHSTAWSQCPVMPATITPTLNPAEYEIVFDFTGIPANYEGIVSFHNTISGQLFWSPSLTSTVNSIIYTIPYNGNFEVYATTYELLPPYCADSVSLGTLTVTSNPTDCNATFTATNVSTNEFSFNANIGYTGVSATPTYSWDFGDGTTGTGNPVNHIYPTGPMTNYDVTLTVTDMFCTDDVTNTVNAGTYISCISEILYVSDSVSAPGAWFSASGTFGSGVWDFGDGTTSTLNPVHHTFASTGGVNIFQVTFIVNDFLCQDTAAITAYAGPNAQCEAIFTLVEDTLNPGDYNGFNFSNSNGVTSYLWDFGDGVVSTDPFPTHTYTAIGVYEVCLTITTDNNCIDTLCLPITVFMKATTTINIMDPSVSLSIDTHSQSTQIAVYPNPTDGNFSITFNNERQDLMTIQLQDVTGKIVYSAQHNVNEGFNVIQLSADDFAQGIYFLSMNGAAVSKVIVE